MNLWTGKNWFLWKSSASGSRNTFEGSLPLRDMVMSPFDWRLEKLYDLRDNFVAVILRVAIINNVQYVCLQRPHRPRDDASTRRWRGSQQTDLLETERCPAYNDRQDDDDAQLHLHSSATSLSRLLLDGAVPITQTAFPRCTATLRRCMSLICLWTRKSPLNFGSYLDTDRSAVLSLSSSFRP